MLKHAGWKMTSKQRKINKKLFLGFPLCRNELYYLNIQITGFLIRSVPKPCLDLLVPRSCNIINDIIRAERVAIGQLQNGSRLRRLFL